MGKVSNKMKNFLIENEIYFKTLATILLSFMAILVSYASYNIQKEVFTEEYGKPELKYFFYLKDMRGMYRSDNFTGIYFGITAYICNMKGRPAYIDRATLYITNEDVFKWKVGNRTIKRKILNKYDCEKVDGLYSFFNISTEKFWDIMADYCEITPNGSWVIPTKLKFRPFINIIYHDGENLNNKYVYGEFSFIIVAKQINDTLYTLSILPEREKQVIKDIKY